MTIQLFDFVTTIICSNYGWYGTHAKWVHPPTAFRNRREFWFFLGTDPNKVGELVGTTDLPIHEGEYDTFLSYGVFDEKCN